MTFLRVFTICIVGLSDGLERVRRSPQFFYPGAFHAVPYHAGNAWGLPRFGPRPLRPFGSAICDLVPANNSMVRGELILEQPSSIGPVQITGLIFGLNPGRHGFHIHEKGDTGDDCIAAGAHFNPANMDHGAPDDKMRHAGDLGNIVAGSDEVANILLADSEISLVEGNARLVIGRSIVVHEGEDDLGRGGDEGSKKTGNAGSRLACCIIKRPKFLY